VPRSLVPALVVLSFAAPLAGCDRPVSWQWQQTTSGTATLTGGGADRQLSFSALAGSPGRRPFDLSAQQTLSIEVGPSAGDCDGRLELELARPIDGQGAVPVTRCSLDLVCAGRPVVTALASCTCPGALLVDSYVRNPDAPDPTLSTSDVPVESLAARLALTIACPETEYEILDGTLAVELLKHHVEKSHDDDDDGDD